MPLETESGTSSGPPPAPTDADVTASTTPGSSIANGWQDETYTKDNFAAYFAPVPGASASDTVLDITQLEYQAIAVLPDGSTVDLSQTIENFTWDELKGEWAMRFSVTLRDTSVARGQIHEVISLGGKVSFWWRLGHGTPGPDWQPIGLGTCWVWEYDDDGLPSINGTLYDDLEFALKSDAILVLWPPTEAINVLYELFKPWAIPLALPWDGPSTTIQRRLKLSGSLADCVQQVLAECFINEKTDYGYGQEYFPRIEFDGSMARLAIRKPGTNSTVWTFAPYQATSRLQVRWSMEEMITQLQVTGSDGNQTFVVSPVDANSQNWGPINFTLNGAYPELGLIRRIQVAAAGDDPFVQRLQAESEMAQFGAPLRTIEVTVFDNPATRRGDTVYLKGWNGVDDGGYHLVGIQHMPAQRQMRLQLDSSGMFDHRRKSFDLLGTPLNVGGGDPQTTTGSDGQSLPPADASAPPPTSTTPPPVSVRDVMFLNPATGDYQYITYPLDPSPFVLTIPGNGQQATFKVTDPNTVLAYDDKFGGWLPEVMTAGTPWPELTVAAHKHGYTGPSSADPGRTDATQNPNPPRP